MDLKTFLENLLTNSGFIDFNAWRYFTSRRECINTIGMWFALLRIVGPKNS